MDSDECSESTPGDTDLPHRRWIYTDSEKDDPSFDTFDYNEEHTQSKGVS
jgi:hypothetical protein